MNETKTQWAPIGLERFSHLEDKLFRMVEEFKVIRKDNESLRNENSKLKEQLQVSRESEAATQESLAHFQKEREDLRERVEKALSLLATLEAQEAH